MSNPLELKQFKHFLNFKSDDLGLFEISEPVKFDASEFVIEQDSKFYARDISFMNQEIDLEFYEGLFEPSENEYQMLNGIIVSNLGHCLDYILEYNKRYGFQSHIEYILERNGTQFILGELNFEGCDTDELSYFKCKIVQSTKKALAKRREDVEVDGFSDVDLDNNYIDPLETKNILLKAKPIVQESNFTSGINLDNYRLFASDELGDDSYNYYNICNVVASGQIENTLSYLENVIELLSDDENTGSLFGYVQALNNLSNITITIKDVYLRQNIDTDNGGDGFIETSLRVVWGESVNNMDGQHIVFSQQKSDSDGFLEYQNDEINLTIPYLGSGKKIFIYFRTRVRQSSDNPFDNPTIEAFTTLNKYTIDIKANSTAIDTVVKAVKYEDILKYNLKAINGNDLIAPDFENGGKFHNLYAFSGNLIRQRDDVPFYFNFKDRMENFQALTNGDVQINEDDAFALQYDKYYDNVENGAFLSESHDNFSMSYNQRYAINVLEYEFKDFEKDDDEENTLDSVHTESQWSINNTRVKNTKKIEVKDIFDPFKIESQRRQTFKETTALDGDDKIHCIDVVNLSPSEKGGFTALMTHNIDANGRVQLLKSSDLPSWALLGFNVGSDFKILSGQNIGNYTVFQIESTIITLTPLDVITPFNGGAITEVEYPFSNVLYKNRTNEGFDTIENLINPNDFSNLRYTIRRNLVHWESYMSTCASYINEDIKNTKFKNNGSLETKYNGGELYKESGDIVLSEIQQRILSPREYEVDVIADYDQVLSVISKYNTIEGVGGFLRVQGSKGDIKKLYPKKLSYNWVNGLLNIFGEERLEPEFVYITKQQSTIIIDNVGYEEYQLSEVFYEANGDYFTLLDNNNIKIINFTKYDRFIVQGASFDNTHDLAQALIEL